MNQSDLFFSAPENTAQTAPQSNDGGGDVKSDSAAVTIARSGDAHYNTTALDGDDLQAARRRNGAQNAVILALFRDSESPLGPWEVMHRCHAAGHPYLIGSVRRAITTLTQDGLLLKLDTKRRGDAGAFEYEWKAA